MQSTREHPFRLIYDRINRITREGGPLPVFPLLIDVEITSQCNLRCIMCEHTYMRRKQEPMNEATFKVLLDQCKSYKPGIRFIMFSEPFLHTNIIAYARRVKQLGMLLHVTTNGTVVTEQQLDQMVELGLDSITFSLQGLTEAEYAFMRANGKYTTVRKRVEYLNSRRHKGPYIQVSTTMSDRDRSEDVEIFRSRWSEVADKVTVGKTSWNRVAKIAPQLGKITGIDVSKRGKRLPCQDIMTKMCVFSNGDVTVCCDDTEGELSMGNVLRDDLARLWKSEAYEAMRTLLRHMKMHMIGVCADCYPAYEY